MAALAVTDPNVCLDTMADASSLRADDCPVTLPTDDPNLPSVAVEAKRVAAVSIQCHWLGWCRPGGTCAAFRRQILRFSPFLTPFARLIQRSFRMITSWFPPPSSLRLGGPSRRALALGLSDANLLALSARLLTRRAIHQTAPDKLNLVIDSGCVAHCHNVRGDLINLRSVDESIVGIDGISHSVAAVGDLPLTVHDLSGSSHELLIPGVRHVPSISVTLVSADQLFASSKAVVLFGRRDIRFPVLDGFADFPFYKAADGLYIWPVKRPNSSA
jgi:hypothetical protein